MGSMNVYNIAKGKRSAFFLAIQLTLSCAARREGQLTVHVFLMRGASGCCF